jgi:hypothetical protein
VRKTGADSSKQQAGAATGASSKQQQQQAGFNPEKPFAALFPGSGSKPAAV